MHLAPKVSLCLLPTFGLKTQTTLTACTCSCCEASAQSFLRSGHAAAMICTPLFAITQASSCPSECNDLQAATAKALHNADLEEGESAVDYSRFCLQSCSPPGAKQSLCTPSIPLPSLDTSLLIAGAKPEAPQTKASAAGQKAAAIAAQTIKIASAQAAAALAEAKAEANMEIEQSKKALASEIKAELNQSAARAAMYAKRASASIKKAEQELQEIKKLPKLAAEQAAKEAIRQLKLQDEMHQQMLEAYQAHYSPTQQPPSAAATIVQSPFKAAIREAEQTQSVYEQKASQLNSEADLLRASAASVEKQLEAYAGNLKLSKVIQSRSHDLLVKSLQKEAQAAEAMDEAHKAGEVVPKYQRAAATAAYRASMLGCGS